MGKYKDTKNYFYCGRVTGGRVRGAIITAFYLY